MRVNWRERAEREGWDIRYTTIGGKFKSDPVNDLTPPDLHDCLRRATSQAFFAATKPLSEPSREIAYWASVVRKIVQRGERPTIHHSNQPAPQTFDSTDDLLAATVGPVEGKWQLDPSFELHPTFEAPFWSLLERHGGPLKRWVTPQASFEGMVPSNDFSERWVDFLVHCPWNPFKGVIEIDGSGHSTTQAADKARDQLLKGEGYRVTRIDGQQALDPDSDPLKGLIRFVTNNWLGNCNQAEITAVHGAATIHRLAYAIAEAVERGFLQADQNWHLDVFDSTGVIQQHADVALDLLEAVAAVWNIRIVPQTVVINGTIWQQGPDQRYRLNTFDRSTVPSIRIVLDPFTPPHAALPMESDQPVIVIRGCLLPVDLAWTATSNSERKNRESTERSNAALERLLQDLFGYDSFREGQREAVSRLLSGGDTLVLLPTGSGKTLIYQVAGLLRPGVTLVVAPLKALIDDQDRRLRDIGIDRTVSLHSGQSWSQKYKKEIQDSIGHGEALMLLVAPERLQIEGFREAIGEAASEQMVNLAVVDEAHCVSEWGHQFRTAYLRLGRNLRRVCADLNDQPPPLLALTATASPRVLSDLKHELEFDESDERLTYRPSSFDRPNLAYRIFHTTPQLRAQKVAEALHWIADRLGIPATELATPAGKDTASGIIFVPHASSGLKLGIQAYSKVAAGVMAVSEDDRIAWYSGAPPNGAITDWDKKKSVYANEFKENSRPVMVSTAAFGMGIDKPNIRYTVNIVLPSSIEAFAQESGRAGRDQKQSFCALVATGSIDEGLSWIQQNGRPPDYSTEDVDIQLGFLQQGFGNVDDEITIASAVANHILSATGPGGQCALPFTFAGKTRDAIEKALFRLLIVGVVDDYTVEYGSKKFTVHLAHFDETTVREATRSFVARSTGINRDDLESTDSVHLENLDLVIETSIRTVITTVYERIEPSRRRALREMLQLCLLEDDNEAIRGRINAYLSEGPVAAILDKQVRGEASILDSLATLGATIPDRLEWAGAAARYLESYPDNPFLISIRALGEAWNPEGSKKEFREQVDAFLKSIESFGLPPREVSRILEFMLEMLRTQFDGERWDWTVELWAAFDDEGSSVSVLRAAEDDVLALASHGEFRITELDHVISRRYQRAARSSNRMLHQLTTSKDTFK